MGRRPPWRTRSARRRPLAPAATPSSARSSARRSPPISSMRTSRCGRSAAAPRSQPPGAGGAVQALGSVVWRAGRDGTDGASSPRPPATSLKHRASSGTGGWLGGCRAAACCAAGPGPRPAVSPAGVWRGPLALPVSQPDGIAGRAAGLTAQGRVGG